MKKYSFLLVILILCSFIRVNAQVSFAPKVGINLSNLGGDATDTQFRLRPQLGGIVEFKIDEMFSFQPGVMYSGKGASGEDNNEIAITLDYLEVPLNGVLNFDMGTGRFQLFAGPYLGYCLSAKYKDDDGETESLQIGTSSDDDIKPFDIGFSIGLGYRFDSFQIQGGYSGSFATISNYEDEKVTNSVISLSLSYFINSQK